MRDGLKPAAQDRSRGIGASRAAATAVCVAAMVMALVPAGAAGAQDPAGLDNARQREQDNRRIRRQVIHINGQEVQLEGGQIVINADGRVVVGEADALASSMDRNLIPSDEALRRVEIDGRLRELVKALDAPEFDERERATAELAARSYAREQLYAVLAGDELSAEQRHRLLGVLQETILNAPRGAVGISMREHRATDGTIEVLVQDLLPGLPAERVMRIGDRITAINGEPLVSQQDLIRRVQIRRPGDRVTLTVRRPKLDAMGREVVDEEGHTILEQLEIDLELGSADLLVNPATGQPQANTEVEMLRRHEITAAERRFSPSARELNINGEWAEASTAAVPEWDELVERHPAVRTIREHRRMIAEGRLVDNRVIRQHWEFLVMEVKSRLMDRDLTDEHRLYLERVIQRMMQLMNR